MRVRFAVGLFPFQVPHATAMSVGPNTEYPVGLSKADALEMFWRRRTCQANWSYYAQKTNGDGMSHSSTGSDACDVIQRSTDPPYASINSERLLVSPGPLDRHGSAGQYFSDGSYSNASCSLFNRQRNSGLSHGDFNGPVFIPQMVFCTDNGLFYPRCSLVLEFLPNPINITVPGVKWSSYPLTFFPDAASWTAVTPGPTITMFGQSFTGHAYASVGLIPDVQSASLTLEGGLDWWAYAGDNGVALYNAGDGTPAINPQTGVAFTPAEIVGASFP